MNMDFINETTPSRIIISPTFTWCFLMPSIHLLSLASNILCIIVFCSNIFIKKPIAIYFISLLLSDSITLFIGYIEMIDRETNMIDKSSWLCMINGKIIHKLSELIYSFMGRFCLEWMLYKVLWTRASTILLAILSVQRTRTFFSLSYHESRLSAFLACIFSIILALTITCLEWTGIQSEDVNNVNLFAEILQSVVHKNSSREFYSAHLQQNYNESMTNYPCLMETFDLTIVSNISNPFNCSSNNESWTFVSLTKSLLSSQDPQIADNLTYILTNLTTNNLILSNDSMLIKRENIAGSLNFITKLFEKRACHVTLSYTFWLNIFDFAHSVSFIFSRHTLAIFFGNALPSFIVVLANLLSIKVIYFSKSLKYLEQASRKNRNKRRSQNDLRAFLVILVESFSVITISWGIPIFLTMYNCHTLYVVNITACPKIKDYLALFLFTDLFNSSTNCLLYSLSGKLFRRKFLSILKLVITCGRGSLWKIKRRKSNRPASPVYDRRPSNNPSTLTNNNNDNNEKPVLKANTHLGNSTLSIKGHRHQNSNNLKQLMSSSSSSTTAYQDMPRRSHQTNVDGRLSVDELSNERRTNNNLSNEVESESIPVPKYIRPVKSPQSIKSFLFERIRSISSSASMNTKSKPSKDLPMEVKAQIEDNQSRERLLQVLSVKPSKSSDSQFSSSSNRGSISYSSLRKCSLNNQCSAVQQLATNSIDDRCMVKHNIVENLTSL